MSTPRTGQSPDFTSLQPTPLHAPISSDLPEFDEATRRFLQSRLTIAFAVALVFVAGFVVAKASRRLGDESFSTVAGSSVPELIVIAGFGLILFRLRRATLSMAVLGLLDAVALWASFGLLASVMVLHRSVFSTTFALVCAIMAQIILMRAIVVPSTAWRTILISIPGPIAVLAIDLTRPWPEPFVSRGEDYGPHIVAAQLVLLVSVAFAALASRLNLTLRRDHWEKTQVGQYNIEFHLGRGGMGDVYRATHARLARPAAIKVLRPHHVSNDNLARFEREARKTASLSHPNNITIYDYGATANGVFFYAMELLDGEDLRALVERTGPMPAEQVVRVLVQVCDALAEAHAKGLVHRDVKPANVMLCELGGLRDFVKVLDYGLVLDTQGEKLHLTLTGQPVGTPETIAPEVFSGEAATAASDIYGAAALGYYLLCGEAVFVRDRWEAMMHAHLNEEPAPLAVRGASVSKDLEAILLRGLSKAPRDRFGSTVEMRDALLKCDLPS